MESSVIELLKPVTLQKENCDPIIFEAGTVLKVVMQIFSKNYFFPLLSLFTAFKLTHPFE